MGNEPSEISVDAEALPDVVDEYLHWRKVNPHIKGGENYLKRLRIATPVPVSLYQCGQAIKAVMERPGIGDALRTPTLLKPS